MGHVVASLVCPGCNAPTQAFQEVIQDKLQCDNDPDMADTAIQANEKSSNAPIALQNIASDIIG